MDYCNDLEGSAWECSRSIFLGIISLVTWLLCVLAVLRVFHAHLRRRSFLLNFVMLAICVLQTSLDWIDYLVKREARVQLMSITLRVLGTILACTAYASFILESQGWSQETFWYAVFPFTFCSVVFTLSIFIAACFEDELACEHPLWLVLSVFQLLTSLIFVGIGYKASLEARRRLQVTNRGSLVVDDRQEVTRKQRDLWLLIFAFLVASIAQVAGDAWRQHLYQQGKTCRFHDSHVEEVARVCLFILSFDLPVWSVMFIFYFLPRHSFEAHYDVEIPAVQLIEQQYRHDDEESHSASGEQDELHPEFSRYVGLGDSFKLRQMTLG